MRRRTQQSLIAAFALALSAGVLAQQSILPNKAGSVKFAVIGDSGTGDANQYRLAEKLIGFRTAFPYEFVLMLGDNSYGGDSAKDYEQRFERPYKPLLDAGLKFYAALGNHDTPNERLYKGFNMSGERIGMEDLFLPSSALFIRRQSRVRGGTTRTDRADLPEVRRQRRALGARSLL